MTQRCLINLIDFNVQTAPLKFNGCWIVTNNCYYNSHKIWGSGFRGNNFYESKFLGSVCRCEYEGCRFSEIGTIVPFSRSSVNAFDVCSFLSRVCSIWK